ncbi:hypothetical protein N3K63_04950 [Microbacterium sp. W1N]|uniref:hypothetical protein n=1 Tax=Microbacterium festucae TaxID=2977531 RepID=UPI0021BEB1F6|nr:hypothetical protein [Microbacterium festucae]MCT9819632.1 hypothetical protein [Microbacterium festucae]
MDAELRRRGRSLYAAFATEQAIYGVLLVAGLIVVASLHASSSLDVLTVVVFTVLVFWLAHVYAGAVARHGVHEGRTIGIRDSLRAAVRDSMGLLVAALLPCALLLLGTLRVVPDALAGWVALWSCVAILGVLGYVAFRRRGAPMAVRLLGAATTAGFGALMALLKAIVH